MDLPVPPTPDEVARDFGLPIVTLAPQPAIEESYIGVSWQSEGTAVQVTSADVSYTLWNNPQDHSDPVNLADLDEATRAALDDTPDWPLPDWLLSARELMRYPSLWEAVRTTHLVDPEGLPWHTAEFALVQHVNYVLVNTFREERTDGSLPPDLQGEVTEKCIEHAIPVSLDGRSVPGLRIDTDPHVLGLAIDLGTQIVTAAIPRDYLPLVTLDFVTRPL